MEIIKVPDIVGPTEQLCWKQSRLLTRCDRRKGHQGPHSWDHPAPSADGWQPTLDEMRLASHLCDEANGTSDYNMRLVALALIAREFLRRFPAPPDRPEAK